VPQPLPNDFYTRALGYLHGLEESTLQSDAHTLQGRLITREREIAKRLFDELRETRLLKIISATKIGNEINPTDLTEEEKALVAGVSTSLVAFNGKAEETPQSAPSPESPTQLVVVRFLQDIPEIVGVDLRMYGPYKKEDVGSLPKQNALALIKQGTARQIEVKGLA
jgi:DNA replication initiation complex subunit (GINS family)